MKEKKYKYGIIGVILGLLILMLAFHKFIFLYADDLYYSRDAVATMKNFSGFAIEELRSNGRVWVHYVLQILLLDGIRFFRLVNPFVIVSIAFLMAKVGVGKDKSYKKLFIATLVVSLFFLILPVEISEDTIYYAACSLNYLYPMGLVILYGYLLIKEHEKMDNEYKLNYFLIPIALLAGSSHQQPAMIAIGFSVMTSLYYLFYLKRKISYKVIYYYASLIAGFSTIVYGSILRMQADKGTGTEIILSETLSQIVKTNIFSMPAGVFVLIISICSIFVIWKYIKNTNINKKYLKNTIIGWLGCYCISLVLFIYIVYVKGLTISLFSGNKLKILFVIAFTLSYILLTLFASYLIFRFENNPIFFFSIINSVGAQLMLVVADARYAETYRVMLPSLMLNILFVIYVISNNYKSKRLFTYLAMGIFFTITPLNLENKQFIMIVSGIFILMIILSGLQKMKIKNIIAIISVGFIIFLAYDNMSTVYNGYEKSAYYQNYNLNAIAEYRANGNNGVLTLKYVPVTIYGHSLGRWNEMPYYMKQCYKIPEQTVVEYIE